RLGFLDQAASSPRIKSSASGRDGPDRQRKAPRERKSLTRGLSVPRYGGRWGERRLTYKRRTPIAKGRSRASVSAPLLPFLSVPTPGRRRSAIATMKLRLAEGRKLLGEFRMTAARLRASADGCTPQESGFEMFAETAHSERDAFEK